MQYEILSVHGRDAAVPDHFVLEHLRQVEDEHRGFAAEGVRRDGNLGAAALVHQRPAMRVRYQASATPSVSTVGQRELPKET
jgi:hypothetical protein